MEHHNEGIETERVEKRTKVEPRTVHSENEILTDAVELNDDNKNAKNSNCSMEKSQDGHVHNGHLEDHIEAEIKDTDVNSAPGVCSVETDVTRSIDSGLESVVSEEISDSTNLAEADSISNESARCESPITDELRSSIQEPEEDDHRERCSLLHHGGSESPHDGSESPHDVDKCTGGEKHATEGTGNGTDRDGWLRILGNDQLKKKVLREGSDKRRPTHGQVVTVRWCSRLDDSTEIDQHDTFRFTLGDGDVISALDLCVALMDMGEVCEIVAMSRFAYGDLGRSPDVPPNATLTLKVELLDFEDSPAIETLTIAQRIELANAKRERGNVLYARNEFSRSIDSYSKALKILDDEFECHNEDASELQRLVDTRVTCHNNLAAAQLKEEAWDAAIKSCELVLKVQPENVKALFRKGKCLANKGEVSLAIPILKRALKLEPETRIIHQELSRLEKKNKAQSQTEKELYQKMLGTDKQPFIPPKQKNSRWLWYVGGAAAAVLVSIGLTAFRYSHF